MCVESNQELIELLDEEIGAILAECEVAQKNKVHIVGYYLEDIFTIVPEACISPAEYIRGRLEDKGYAVMYMPSKKKLIITTTPREAFPLLS